MRLLPSLPLLLLMILAGPAAAEISLAEVSRGSLLLPSGEAGRYQPAPLQETDALIRVTGPIARTRLRQRFSNPGDTWAEAIYAFPLPEHAAVDRLRLRVGERVIEGEIREKAQARAEYAAARAAGQRSALVEQQRPNLFTTAVANIPPHGEVSVEIEYQQTIAWRDAAFSLRLPLAITPRYTPSAPVRHSFTLGAGWSLLPGELSNAADLVPLVDGRPTTHNPVRLAIELRPGFAPERLESRFHSIEREDRDGTIHLHLSGPAPANRDFELVWAPGEAARPQGAFFTETTEAGHFGLLMLMPPRGNFPAAHRVARELIFVIDTSGSMGGASIRQARQALDLALQAQGDLEIDAHHTVEDVGITLGQAFAQAVGDKAGIKRYGHAYVPLDEALSRVVVDLSGRPGLFHRVSYPRARIGDFDVDLLREFFQGFVNHAQVSLHIDNLQGDNAHHIAETVFKAFGRALRMACAPDPRMSGVPSTKGSL